MKVPNPEKFKQDESGQWWYYFGKSKPTRARVYVVKCKRCGEDFVQTSTIRKTGNKVEHCSRTCDMYAFVNENPNHFKGEKNGRWKGGTMIRKGFDSADPVWTALCATAC